MTSLLSLITPTNLDIEREKFLADKTHNPVFNYIWQEAVIEPEFTSKAKYKLWEAIKIQDHAAIVEAASELLEVRIDEETLDYAIRAAQEEGQSSEGSALELKELFEQAFVEFGIDYQVRIVPQSGFNVRPQHGTSELLISEHVHFEYFSMEAEVHHELVHIIRHLNGKHNKIKVSQGYLPTEEGLASWCQDVTNNDLSQVQHAMEYVASAVGIGSSLRDIYECLRGLGMSESLAWKRASRHKFGFVDTSTPGDILKPAMYFANAQKVAKLTQDERLRLFVGKISLDELGEHPRYSGIWPAEELNQYFKLSDLSTK